jgi:hypothetical protein
MQCSAIQYFPARPIAGKPQSWSRIIHVVDLPALVPVWHVAILTVCRPQGLAYVGCGCCCSCCISTALHHACTSCTCVHCLQPRLLCPLLLLCCTYNVARPILLQLAGYTRAMAALKLACCLHQQQVSASSPNSASGRT